MAIVTLGLLKLHPLQRWLESFYSDPKWDKHKKLRVPSVEYTCQGYRTRSQTSSPIRKKPCQGSGGFFWRLCRTSGVSAGQRWISLPQRHQPIVPSGSPMTENTSPLGQDALALKWPEFFLYAFPLFIFPTLLRVLHWGRRVFLVIPFWPARTLFSLLHRLRFRTPWPKVTGDCLYKCPVCMSVRWKISTNKYCLWQLSRVLEPWLHL